MRYIHYSSRPEEPQVPPRAMNRFSGGTGPLGVYTYQEDVRATFAADRPHVFVLTPTVPVLHTDRYTQADLDRDLRKLEEMIVISKPLRLWEKYRREFRNAELPFTKLWYVISHVEREPDPEMPISYGPGSGFADPRLGRDLLVHLGHLVIDDRLGILYSSEPEQAVFLTDGSFIAKKKNMTKTATRRNPADRDQLITDVVMAATRETTPWAVGSQKRFIIDVYDTLEAQGKLDGMFLDEFKTELVRLHKAGLLVLARADLVAAMPPRKVAASEIELGPRGPTFNFIVDQRKNPPREDFEEMIARYKREREQNVASVLAALDQSPAIRASMGSGRFDMIIVSGEVSDHESGKFRATYFGEDGPHGHVTRPTMEKIVDEIVQSYSPPFSPMTDDDVIAWTSTEKFIRGSKVTAFVQADNTLRFRAQRAGRYDWAAEISRNANALGVERVDEAIAMLYEALKELPVPNPRRSGFVVNPPWVTKALADAYEILDDKIPTRWLPQLASVQARGSKGIIADLIEFGCGSYGCVLATMDPDTVVKVTSDESEAHFAARISPTLVAPVCVEYHMVVLLSQRHEGRKVHLLWRESAENVGKLDEVLDRGVEVEHVIENQHIAGAQAFKSLYHKAPQRYIDQEIREWLERVRYMGEVIPELKELCDGLLKIWNEQRILFGDLHAGNFGQVTRNGRKVWVITDPGNISVVP